ncbi:MAG: DUF2946 family protein [Zoogloeaceae bacterium]|nr:DUF2946 family protein [Zoogloeaceae bacterium]
MDPSVVAAMAKWPNVPDCRGWLSLDRRGQWRLQGSPVRHDGLAGFIGRNYACDETGAWFMQNGPQRVWVELNATPWIFHLAADGSFVSHTGVAAGAISAAWLVDNEALCLQTALGFGLVDDRDLHLLLEMIRRPDGALPDGLLDAEPALHLLVQGRPLPLQRCAAGELERIGGFRQQP